MLSLHARSQHARSARPTAQQLQAPGLQGYRAESQAGRHNPGLNARLCNCALMAASEGKSRYVVKRHQEGHCVFPNAAVNGGLC
jgi:hypothetical protein